MNNEIVSDSDILQKEWANHFEHVCTSRVNSLKDLQLLKLRVDEKLLAASFSNEEYLLDVPFSAAEVMTAVRRLKRNKAAGPDGLLAEHLKFAGEHVIIWLRNIMNVIIELEAIPDFMKMGLVVLVL